MDKVVKVSQRVERISSIDQCLGPTDLFCLPYFTNEETEAPEVKGCAKSHIDRWWQTEDQNPAVLTPSSVLFDRNL